MFFYALLALLLLFINSTHKKISYSVLYDPEIKIQLLTHQVNQFSLILQKNQLNRQKQNCFKELLNSLDSLKIILQKGIIYLEEVDRRILFLQNHNFYIKSFSLERYQTDYCTYLLLLFNYQLLNNNIIIQQQLMQTHYFIISSVYGQKSTLQVLQTSTRLLMPRNINTLQFKTNLRRNIILTICWCLLSDLAIIIKFMRSIPNNYSLHVLLFSIVSIITLVELIMLIIQGIPDYIIKSKQMLAYYWLGIILIFTIIIQIFFGFYMRILQKKPNIYPGTIQKSIIFHKVVGFFVLTLAKAQVMYSWYLSSQYITMIIIGIYIILQLIAFLIFKNNEKTLAQMKILLNSQQIQLSILPDASQIYSRLMKLPYNSPQLQSYSFFIHNDNVYQFSNFEFHPGGRKIIQLANHRQIDRFIYGMYHLEQYPQLNRFSHPQNALKLLNPPIYKLQKNPLYNIRSSKFVVQQKISITDSLSIYYFRQQQGQLQFNQQYDLTNIGQYFTIKGFQLTRMYTCVKSQRRQYRRIAKYLLKLLDVNFIQQLQKSQNIFQTNLSQQSLQIIEPKSQNFIEQFYGNKRDPVISLVIKKYKNPDGFSYKLYEKYKTCKLQLSGLHGRGLCLSSIPKGTVVLMAGGGIFPFLDILDILFKILASNCIKLPSQYNFYYQRIQNQVNIYKNLMQGFKFILFGAFTQYKQIVIPDQLLFMENCNESLFKMYLRFTQPNQYFNKVVINERFDNQFVKKYLASLRQDLSMIYICGPPRMSKDILQGAIQNNIPNSKIFFV